MKETDIEKSSSIHESIRYAEVIKHRKETTAFREDIALVRALAILAVLSFHFWPTIFPSGFLGVDIFFVISGYLMIVMLERSAKIKPLQMFIDFYYKRVKRICPVYFFSVFLAGFFTMFVYSTIWAQRHFVYYLPSTLFALNLKMVSIDGDYFEQINEETPFLHFWSLSVEMQFYLVAPIIFLCSKIRINDYHVGPLILIAILLASLKFRLESTPVTAFYSPFARLWQFLVGMLSSMFGLKQEVTEQNQKIEALAALFFWPIFLVFLPFNSTNEKWMQIFVTTTAGLFMAIAPGSSVDWSKFHLHYIAQISYLLYLVHYPVLSFAKYLTEYNGHNVTNGKFMALLLTFAISVILHHFYEKPMLYTDMKTIFKEILKYFLLALLIGWKWELVAHPECALKATVEANRKASTTIYPGLKDLTKVNTSKEWTSKEIFGHYRWKNGKGKHRVVIAGNSWALQQAHLVNEILPDSYVETMDLFGWGAHAIPLVYKKGLSEDFWSYVERTRPDIVFILVRYTAVDGNLDPLKKNDTVLQIYLDVVKRLSQFADHIFIETHQPFCPRDHADPWGSFLDHFTEKLEKGDDLKKNFLYDFNEESFKNEPPSQRIDIVLKECSKCHRLFLGEPFIDRKRKKILTYDEKTELSYLDNTCHLTVPGLELIKKPFQEAIQKALHLGEIDG